MTTTDEQNGLIELTADIVSAYVSKNSVAANEVPALIGEVFSALSRAGTGAVAAPVEPAKPAVSPKKSITPLGLSDLPGRREEVQVAQAPSADHVQHVPGAISREVGPCRRLSDGRSQLCRGAVSPREGNGPRPEAQTHSASLKVEVFGGGQSRPCQSPSIMRLARRKACGASARPDALSG